MSIEISTSIHATGQVETSNTRGSERVEMVVSRERGNNVGRGGSSGRKNTAARVDVITREGSYLESAIPNDFLTSSGGGHGIIVERKIDLRSSTL